MDSTYGLAEIRASGKRLMVHRCSHLCMRKKLAGLQNPGRSNHMKFKARMGLSTTVTVQRLIIIMLDASSRKWDLLLQKPKH